ncbi:hypothetical protein ACFRH6_20855 [Streptomyces sp. NPDC056749]|uniref:hypothetical protein n=1 Tax=Streptomyces sp. NPDC056749 TaxID=3345936 RepID=UPI0036844504
MAIRTAVRVDDGPTEPGHGRSGLLPVVKHRAESDLGQVHEARERDDEEAAA